MRISILSDTHLGDPMCGLVVGNLNDGYKIGPKYTAFKNAISTPQDYLVLLGDVLDFSIASFAEAYEAAKVFFQQLVNDNITREIVYLPGNHDYQFWTMVEHEVNVVRRIKNGKRLRGARWSVPAIFDFRDGCNHPGFKLPEVSTRGGQGSSYGGLFLDYLTENKIPFNVAYPNLYLVTNDETVLLTHGHYLESYWAAAGEIAPKIVDDLPLEGEAPNLKELVAINTALNQLACTGVGQAGPLSAVIRKIQRNMKDEEHKDVMRYLDNLDDKVLDEYFDYKWYDIRELTSDVFINIVIKILKNQIKNFKPTRYAEDFIDDQTVQARFENYLFASIKELSYLNRHYQYDKPSALPDIKNIIFAHTHVPISWSNNSYSRVVEKLPGKSQITLHNTGGWLFKQENGTRKFVGAEIFHCDDGVISSRRVT